MKITQKRLVWSSDSCLKTIVIINVYTLLFGRFLKVSHLCPIVIVLQLQSKEFHQSNRHIVNYKFMNR